MSFSKDFSASADNPDSRPADHATGQAYQWAPLHIELILHFYTSRSKHPHHGAPAVKEFTNELLSLGLIEHTTETESGYWVTKQGKDWADAICFTPLPKGCRLRTEVIVPGSEVNVQSAPADPLR